ncbi:MAG TPA: carboxypeptidase-like regulatory domain-containing protein, partial [Blastocatellia bacterium]
MKKFLCLLMMACAVSFCLPVGATSQITGGTVAGTVRNQTGAPVAGAKIVATHQGTNQSRSVTTDEAGAYRLPGLAVGEYEVTVEAERFARVVRRLSLRINEDSRLDFELAVAGTEEQVQVVGSTAPLTETQNSVLGIIIENKQILELPLNGRNFLQLGTLVANVNSTATLSGGSEGGLLNGPFAVAGQRDRSLTFLVDGVDNNNALSNSLSAQVSLDAIQEFKLVTNLGSAEHGFHSGGMVNILTRSGSNEFHLTAFDFFRNNKLDAANHFEKLTGRDASKFNNNQFGVTAGGRIIKDKTFYLASYEGQRLRVGQPQFSNVPTLDQRNGIFFSPLAGRNVQLPVDPVAAAILDRYVPLPNVESEFGNYLGVPTIKGRNDFAMGRVDHLLTGDDVINARYFLSDNDSFNPIIFNVILFPSVPPSIPGFGLNQSSLTHNLAVNYIHNFSAQTINELRFGYNHHRTDLDPEN